MPAYGPLSLPGATVIAALAHFSGCFSSPYPYSCYFLLTNMKSLSATHSWVLLLPFTAELLENGLPLESLPAASCSHLSTVENFSPRISMSSISLVISFHLTWPFRIAWHGWWVTSSLKFCLLVVSRAPVCCFWLLRSLHQQGDAVSPRAVNLLATAFPSSTVLTKATSFTPSPHFPPSFLNSTYSYLTFSFINVHVNLSWDSS